MSTHRRHQVALDPGGSVAAAIGAASLAGRPVTPEMEELLSHDAHGRLTDEEFAAEAWRIATEPRDPDAPLRADSFRPRFL